MGDQGERGIEGRRGEKGETGVQGEQGRGDRGVKGDQGEQGHQGVQGGQGIKGVGRRGDRGPEGMRGRPTRTIVVLLVALVTFMTWTLWQGEHDSCLREAAPRASLTVKLELDALRAEQLAAHQTGPDRATNLYYAGVYRRLITVAPKLHCGRLLPDVGGTDTRLAERILDEARRR